MTDTPSPLLTPAFLFLLSTMDDLLNKGFVFLLPLPREKMKGSKRKRKQVPTKTKIKQKS